MDYSVVFSLSFDGGDASKNEIDLYDVAHALIGFQRSLALTTHLVLHDEVITQAPALKNASIHAFPAKSGSWEILTGISIFAGGLYYVGTAPRDTPLGHIVYSAYDYVVKLVVGVRVDYSKSLGQQFEELKENGYKGPILRQSRLDSVAEKCETALKELHRPISGKRTAERAKITARVDGRSRVEPVGAILNETTFSYLDEVFRGDELVKFSGRVTSYNSNTFKGRVFILSEGRPIAFDLSLSARSSVALAIITQSLSINTLRPAERIDGFFEFRAFTRTSRSGLLKAVDIVEILA